jgi:hypothetical protein
MKILCKIFGHKWTCFVSGYTGYKYRYCKLCNKLQEYRKCVPGISPGWFTLVRYTKKGGDAMMKERQQDRAKK